MGRTLSENQIKGIDLTVRVLKKVFPFVKGWKLDKTWEKYETNLYLDLDIDVTKLSEVINMEVREYYIKKLKTGESITSSAILTPFDWGDIGSEKWEEVGQSSHLLRMKINDTLRKAYDFLPDEMKVFWRSSFNTHPCVLSVDEFIFEL